MSNKYSTKVNDHLEFEFTEKDISSKDILKTFNTNYNILHEHKSIQTEIVKEDFTKKSYSVKVNGTIYNVTINDVLDQKIKEMGFSLGSSKQVDVIKAPMPGLLLDIHVSEGQNIKEDEPLLILEAMKMENSILSPRDGVIKSISATKGDTVDKGQLLIEFEK